MSTNLELYKFYNVSECSDINYVFEQLDELCENGKIHFEEDINDKIIIEDIDLTEDELKKLSKMLEKHDVLPDLNIEDEDEDFSDFEEDFDF